MEEWKDIKGFEETHMISNHGNIWLKRHKRLGKTSPDRAGYIKTGIWREGKTISKFVHRLVAKNFKPNPENKPIVHHIDDDKANNHVDNLEWVTNKEHGLLTSEESKEKRRKTYVKNRRLREKNKKEKEDMV